MSDLVEFLLARVAEDEAEARAAQADAMVGFRWKHWPEGAYYEIQAATLTSTRRTRAECEAKRRIVERAAPLADSQVRRQTRTLALGVMLALALPYADHPDFDPAWRLE